MCEDSVPFIFQVSNKLKHIYCIFLDRIAYKTVCAFLLFLLLMNGSVR